MIAAARVRAGNTGAAARTLPPAAWAYLGLVVTVAVALAGVAIAGGRPSVEEWFAFAVLASCAAAAEVFLVPSGSNHGFNSAILFVVAATLLLPVELVALVGLAQHLPDVLKRRYPWYIATFNVANYTLSGLAGWGAAHLVAGNGIDEVAHRFAVAGVAAALVWILLNHVLLAVMLRLARGHSFRESGLFSKRGIGGELAVGVFGVALAALWSTNVWLAPAAMAPLLLSHRSFSNLGALRETEDRFRAMFESAIVGAVVLDLGGRILSTNRAFEEMLGFAKGEVAGAAALDLVHEEDRERGRGLFRELVEGRRPEYRLEQRFHAKGGRVVWAEVALSLARDADDFPRFAIATLDDVTRRHEEEHERARLEQALRQAQKMEAVGQLAGGIAHDFNNLLTAISGYAELALGRAELSPGVRRDVEEIHKSADRAGALTRQLLGFSRKQIIKPAPLDLKDVVGDVERLVRRLIGENIEVATVFGRAVPLVHADPGQLEQVLVNLVVNARDAMPDGGRLVIETGFRNVDAAAAGSRPGLVPGPYVTLAVRDDGHGIDDETKAKVFEPFFTTKEPGKGTGLGLATVYGIVKQNNGYIELESEPGQGATFTVYLRPLDEVPAEHDDDGDESGSATAAGSERVLLVEDEDVVRTLLCEVLEMSGYEVLAASNGLDALELARGQRRPIDLLITDVVMPKMSGRELADHLRSIHWQARVLYMSGYTDGAIVQSGVLDASTEFLQKPFSFDDLAGKVRSILDAGPAR
jgi:PAS domain S-box-containing protein